MRQFTSVLSVMLLSVCNVLQETPQPAPPVADHPQETRRDQSNGLQRSETVSALVRNSPDGTLTEICVKATAARTDCYVVLPVDETIVTS